MKTSVRIIYTFIAILGIACIFSSFKRNAEKPVDFAFPYKQAGLTERQAAAHLLSRFTYGPTKEAVDEVVKMGLEQWFQQQLDGNVPDDSLNKMLVQYEDINLTNNQVEDKYPRQAKLVKLAIKDGSIHPDSVNKGDQKAYRAQLKIYMDLKGYKPEQELIRQFINQKILRAAYTNNQLQELLTDFWFNHFNVSLTKNQCALYVPSFERDIIRPNVTGKFSDLLIATAKSPAMLIFLDNYTSSGQRLSAAELAANANPEMMMGVNLKNRPADKKPNAQNKLPLNSDTAGKVKKVLKKPGAGLNENYAREVMELHTLGVDGGYTQNDVTQAARVLTGWTIAPIGEDGSYGAGYKKVMENIGEQNLEKRGFIHQGDFLFVPTRHDNQEKMVLGKRFPANGGYEEGMQLLNMLAHHPSTAKFISTKLATRFVNDQPPKRIIDKMAKTFTSSDGDIRQVMIAMVTSAEFWKVDALREKTKSPFELAISAVRSLDANVTQPYQLFNWINRMGQKMYYYQAPTGFPDKGQYWINTGALLNRMNFGLALAAQRIPGVKINLFALNNNHEPESAEAALLTYSKLILPERNLEKTLERLKPMLSDPNLTAKVQNAADKTAAPQPVPLQKPVMGNTNTMEMGNVIKDKPVTVNPKQALIANNNMLAQVVGVIIGSPEFQRK
ncbi:DUF1800 domain-containing protein [Pedobacter metabolipauper]|uniref:Uncharacterized protein (DUF1800 family) n=1 Tax=Pedobacter metabolipauper TaxID=425513 RepID=A0A4R6SQW6_9SPHI|nr:DUF1800 domain-containing protein [Pedobacter metabolipauper]TDQ06605.1 uncharacterized protein (DUF1800 family) [Pedobacter metabolipauper]